MIKEYFPLLGAALLFLFNPALSQQLPPIFDNSYQSQKDSRVKHYLTAKRIVWSSDKTSTSVVDAQKLLVKGSGQADLVHQNFCKLISTDEVKPGILRDFGKEI